MSLYRLRYVLRAPVAPPVGAGRREYATPEAADRDGPVTVHVRAISAELVRGHWVDHRDQDHLRDAVPLFQRRVPLMPMHDADPRYYLGYATGGAWDETPMGPQAAPGINVAARLDPGIGPHARAAARGVADGALDRWSVGIEVDAEPSHPDLDETQFWTLLGQEHQGEPVRFIAREILDVYELSLVDAGAIESARTLAAQTETRHGLAVVERPLFSPPPLRRRPPARRQ